MYNAEILKKVVKLCNENAGAITIGATALTFVTVILKLLLLSGGDLTAVNYIIRQAGVADLWLDAIISVSGYIISLLLASVSLFINWSIFRKYNLLILGWGFFILAVLPVVFIFSMILYQVWRWLSSKVKRAAVGNAPDNKKTDKATMIETLMPMLVVVGSYLLVYSTMPYHVIKLHGGDEKLVQVIAEKEDYVAVVEAGSGVMQEVSRGHITERRLCRVDGAWWLRSVYDIARTAAGRGLLPECPELTPRKHSALHGKHYPVS